MDNATMIEDIRRLKEEKDVIIMAHLYQPDEIQAVADYTGDSLGLSRLARDADQKVIMFCGVKFMAETAKILSPEKTVVLPRMDGLCYMAAMVDVEEIAEMRKKHPGAAVVTYVNSTTDVKAVSDYCCTSANAVNLCRNIPEQEIIFVPDKNLGAYIAQQVPEKKVYLVSGFCPTHHRLSAEDVKQAREHYPVCAHPGPSGMPAGRAGSGGLHRKHLADPPGSQGIRRQAADHRDRKGNPLPPETGEPGQGVLAPVR